MPVSRLIARPLIASGFLLGAVSALRNTEAMALKAAPVTAKLVPRIKQTLPQLPIPEDPRTQVRVNAAVQIGAGLALATGRAPRTAAFVLAASLVPTTLAGHAFWAEPDPRVKGQQRLAFFKNMSMLGGLLVAAGDTEGKPGVAWRTGRLAKDARREARHLAKAARREAALAKAKVT